MKRFFCLGAFFVITASVALLMNKAVGQTAATGTPAASPADQSRAMIDTYCVGCHSTRLKTGGLALQGLDLKLAENDAQPWEKVLRKLRGRLMPPPGSPQPEQKDIDAFS